MLPIRWILPIGGLLLTIALLTLVFNAPDGSRSQLIPNVTPVRVAMIELGERPEWQQFTLLHASQRRTDELNRLRELPDTPARADTAPAALEAAELPTADRSESISIELPGDRSEEKPAQRVKSRNQTRIKSVQHVHRRARVPASRQPLPPNNLFGQPFGYQTGQRPVVNTNTNFGSQQVRQAWTTKASNHFDNQPGQKPTPAANNY